VGPRALNLAPTGIQSPDRPARSQSLYRLNYPGLRLLCTDINVFLNYELEKEVRKQDRLEEVD
jgi:hypothetical protein